MPGGAGLSLPVSRLKNFPRPAYNKYVRGIPGWGEVELNINLHDI